MWIYGEEENEGNDNWAGKKKEVGGRRKSYVERKGYMVLERGAKL